MEKILSKITVFGYYTSYYLRHCYYDKENNVFIFGENIYLDIRAEYNKSKGLNLNSYIKKSNINQFISVKEKELNAKLENNRNNAFKLIGIKEEDYDITISILNNILSKTSKTKVDIDYIIAILLLNKRKDLDKIVIQNELSIATKNGYSFLDYAKLDDKTFELLHRINGDEIFICREPGNINKNTFDYIKYIIDIYDYSNTNTFEYIKANINDIFKFITRKLAKNKEYIKFGVPINYLKATANIYNNKRTIEFIFSLKREN